MNARRPVLALVVALLLTVLAVPAAEAARKLSVGGLDVPPTGRAGEPLAISGTLRNSGDERARATVRAYLAEELGQIRLGGRKLGVAAGHKRKFSMAPALPTGAEEGEYEISVCARRLNRRGPVRCRSVPLTIEG